MAFIDEEGKVFGIVNIIDALVVLLLLSVVSAGAVFVLQPDGSSDSPPADDQNTKDTSPATRYATVNLGTHPKYLAALVTEGDTVADGSITITDVYHRTTKKGTRVWARLKLDGKSVTENGNTEFLLDGKYIRPSSKVPVVTDEYQFKGTVFNISDEGTNLPGGTSQVVLRATTNTEVVTAIQENDTYTLAGNTVGTVRKVSVYPTGETGKKRVVLGVTIQALKIYDQRTFLGRPIRVGRSLPFRTDAYSINAQVVHRGNVTQPGESTTTTVTLELSRIAPEIAKGISTGMVERIGEHVNARITDKQVEPATIVLKSQNGTIHKRKHPTKKDVQLTVELETRQTDSALYFHGKQLQTGDDLVLDLGTLTVHGQVTDIQRDE